MSEPPPVSVESIVILHARRGRPRVSEPCVPVSTWIPARTARQLDTVARAGEVSTSALVRALVIAGLRQE